MRRRPALGLLLLLASLAAPPAAAQRPAVTPPAPRAGALLPPILAPLDRTRIPPPGPPPRIALPAPRRYSLPGGRRLLVAERHTLPMVAVAVVWPGGSRLDPPGSEGLAALTASLLDEGAGRRGPLDMAAELQGLGSHLEASSGWDSSALSLVTLARNLEASLALLADVALRPLLAPAELERVRAQQRAAARQRKDSAEVVASERLQQAIYGTRRYGLPAGGSEESLARIGGDEVQRQAAAWRRGDWIILVAGDVEAEAARRLVERHFGPALSAPPAARPASAAEAALPAPRRVVIDRRGAPQSEVRLGLPGPPRTSPDFYALLVMNEILGGGDFSNRLNLNLRETHAYSYGAHSGFAFLTDGGPFVVATAAKTEVTGAAVRELLAELERIRSEAVRADELRFAKDALERGLARRFETLADVVAELAVREVFGLPADYFERFAARVEAVRDVDVLRVARQYLDPAQLSLVIAGDRQAVASQLEQLPGPPFEGLPPSAKPAGQRLGPRGAAPPLPAIPAR